MEAWRQGAQEVHQQRNHPEKNPIGEREREREKRERRERRRAGGAHEALPQNTARGKPLRPRPLSLELQIAERRESVKGTKAAQNRRALDRFPPFWEETIDEGKGAIGKGETIPSRSSGKARLGRA